MLDFASGCGNALSRRSAGGAGRLQLAARWRRDGHSRWQEDFPHRRRQVLQQQRRLGPAGADRRAGHRPAPEHPAPDDRRRDPDAPRRETRPAGHRRRSRPQVQRDQVAVLAGGIRPAPEGQEDHAGRFQARHPPLHHRRKGDEQGSLVQDQRDRSGHHRLLQRAQRRVQSDRTDLSPGADHGDVRRPIRRRTIRTTKRRTKPKPARKFR